MTWRDKYKVHPAADVFPMMGDDELKALGEDIKVNGLQEPLTFWWQTTPKRQRLLVDGRNRLEAMERAGIELPRTIAVRNGSHTITAQNVIEGDPVAFIISANIRRRHLTKQQQADLILAAIKAAPIVRQRGEKIGKGRPVDEVKAAAVKAGTEHGISKRTVERAFAKADDKEKSAERIARAKAAAEKRKAKREADRKERAERFRESFGLGAREGDGSWQRLAKVLVMLSSDHEGERHAAADAANKILPMGWQLVKAPLDPKPGQGALHKLDAARGHYLECVKFEKDLDGEQDIIRAAFREIAGKRAMASQKRASTLPQDGRSEDGRGDPTPAKSSELFASSKRN